MNKDGVAQFSPFASFQGKCKAPGALCVPGAKCLTWAVPLSAVLCWLLRFWWGRDFKYSGAVLSNED